jgi:hypothetical protein
MNRNTLALLVALLASTALAHADVISPEESACSGHAAGDACILPAGTAGRCASRSLARGDASRPALVCVAGDDGGVADGGVAPAPESSNGCDVARTRGRVPAGVAALGLALALACVGRRRQGGAAASSPGAQPRR